MRKIAWSQQGSAIGSAVAPSAATMTQHGSTAIYFGGAVPPLQ
ncbi:MAG TPA: hypothetical protein VGP52_02965 [Stellaceae bacterium]|jgi:hypothetical protein|nr:hypothetical protein [Stellaceae bacterium]